MTPREKRLITQFNLTLEMWQKIFDFQKGLCGICKQPLVRPNAKGTGLSPINVDHRHSDGLVLGLLCFRCNQCLGEALTIKFLRAALEYKLSPPATAALGCSHYGLPGRVTTKMKTKRELYEKLQKAAQHET